VFSGPSYARSTRPESAPACRYEAWIANEAGEKPRLSNEDHTGVDGRVEPLVRVAGDRVGLRHGPKCLGRARRDYGERPVRPVDVQPQLLGASDAEELGDRVDRPRSDRPRRGHDRDRTVPALPVLLDHPSEGIHAYPVALVDGDQSNGIRSHTEELRGLLMAVIGQSLVQDKASTLNTVAACSSLC
jgi:hypothetical protein